MAKKLFVGNLSHDIDENQLQELFETFGTVESSKIIKDRETGRSKGFGFVEMADEQEAQTAIEAMNGKEASGRALTVNEARPRKEHSNVRSGGFPRTNRRY